MYINVRNTQNAMTKNISYKHIAFYTIKIFALFYVTFFLNDFLPYTEKDVFGNRKQEIDFL